MPAGWGRDVAPDETVLWQGKPDGRFRWADLRLYPALTGVAFTAVGMLLLTQEGPGFARDAPDYVHFIFPGFGAILLLSGVYAIVGLPLQELIRRRGSDYLLTDRAAYVVLRRAGRSAARWPLTRDMDLSLRPDSVIFARRRAVDPDEADKVITIDVGFLRIAQAHMVFNLMQKAIAALPSER